MPGGKKQIGWTNAGTPYSIKTIWFFSRSVYRRLLLPPAACCCCCLHCSELGGHLPAELHSDGLSVLANATHVAVGAHTASIDLLGVDTVLQKHGGGGGGGGGGWKGGG
jgi:hypothetical protein